MDAATEGARSSRGATFYDDPDALERYLHHRGRGPLSPNHVMEEPAFFDELGSVEGMRVLDLGCGDGALGALLCGRGCLRYVGVDGSYRMVALAREALRDTAGNVIRSDIEDFRAPSASFDLIVSRLALHYIDDVAAVLASCRDHLAPGGRVILTVVHPVITSHDARGSTKEPRNDWVVDNYFARGPREQEWLGARTVWFHRTVEDYVTALRDAGFSLTALRECAPNEERFEGDVNELARRRRIPMFLLLSGTAP